LENHKDSKVIAGARKPSESEILKQLAQSYPNRLTLVAIDTSDTASVKVWSFSFHSTLLSPCLSPQFLLTSEQKAAAEVAAKHPSIDYTVVNAAVNGAKLTYFFIFYYYFIN